MVRADSTREVIHRSTRLVAAGVAAVLLWATPALAQPLTITTLAGPPGGPGWYDGTGTAAQFGYWPQDVAADGAGNLYVAEYATIRRVVPATGEVTTLAGRVEATGWADGPASAALFSGACGVAVDEGRNVFVADCRNRKVRRIDLVTRQVTTLAGGGPLGADGTGSAAGFSSQFFVAADGAGNVYVSDPGSETIRKIVVATREVTTLAGYLLGSGGDDGVGSAARFRSPGGITADGAGNLFVADTYNHTIRQIAIASARVTTLAGLAGEPGSADGVGSGARFGAPVGIATDGAGNLFVAETSSHRIRKIAIASAQVTTLAGLSGEPGSADGVGTAARFWEPRGLAVGDGGDVFVADSRNTQIRRIQVPTALVTTIAGQTEIGGAQDGPGTTARFRIPVGVALQGDRNVFVADQGNHTVRQIDLASAQVTTLAGLAGNFGIADGIGSAARFESLLGVSADDRGSVFVADRCGIRRIVVATGEVTTIAGLVGFCGSTDGIGSAARLAPRALAADESGNVFVTDEHYTIRKVVVATGEVTTFAGLAGVRGSEDGVGTAARFDHPYDVVADGSGNLFVADGPEFSSRVRKIVIATGEVTTIPDMLAGRLALDRGGNLLAAIGLHIRRLVLATGEEETVAGLVDAGGCSDGTGSTARFDGVRDVAADGSGSVVVADCGKIRLGRPALLDIATIDAATGPIGSPRTLGTSPDTATAWLWEVVRRPSGSVAQLSSPTVRTPSFTPDAPGFFTFRLTATGAGGLQGITLVELTVTCVAAPAPMIATSENPSCPGKGVTLAAWPGYTGYLWSTGETTRAITVHPMATSTYTVRGYLNGCASGMASHTQQVSAPASGPGATNGGPLCEGATLQLRAGYVEGATYSWTGPGGFVSPLRNPTIESATLAAAGTYGVTTTLEGCVSAPSTTEVTVGATPATPAVTAPGSAYAGQTSLLATVTSHVGSTYQWSIVNGTITSGQGSSQIVFAAGAAGSLTLAVTETSAAGCASDACEATLVVAATPPAAKLFTVVPCRALDTRNADRPLGGPALAGTTERVFPIASSACGIPATARAVSANVTVTQAEADGDLRFYPGDGAASLASVINFRTGLTRANNAILALSADGQGSIGILNDAPAPVHVILDVNGYFE